MFIRSVDAISEFTGKLSAWSLFAIGLFITYEIVMRYVFNAPTIWVDEVSRILQVWVVFVAGSYVLKHREMVTIEVVFRDPTSLRRKLAETFALLFMFVFAGTAAFYGFDLWLKSTLAGHTTDTYLAPPKMLTHAPVWLGCVLLIFQGIAEIIRIWTVGIPDDDILDRQH